jgi:hypothetical protein
MKKIVTIISIIALMLIIFVFLGIGRYSQNNKSTIVNKEIAQGAVSKVVSENGLKDWKITMTPKLGASFEYDGQTTVQDLVIKLSTGITLKSLSLKPGIPITINEKQNIYLGKIDVNLEWVNEGEKHSGNAIFQINSNK